MIKDKACQRLPGRRCAPAPNRGRKPFKLYGPMLANGSDVVWPSEWEKGMPLPMNYAKQFVYIAKQFCPDGADLLLHKNIDREWNGIDPLCAIYRSKNFFIVNGEMKIGSYRIVVTKDEIFDVIFSGSFMDNSQIIIDFFTKKAKQGMAAYNKGIEGAEVCA